MRTDRCLLLLGLLATMFLLGYVILPNGFDKTYLLKKVAIKKYAELDIDRLLRAINRTVDIIVDKSVDDLARVYHSGNLCPFHRKVLSKLAHNKPINIEILGGSVTWGSQLTDPIKDRWSHKFEQIMNSGWYGGKISVINRGIPAFNIDSWIQKTDLFKSADLVIVDSTVNDQVFDPQILPGYYETFIELMNALPNRPALLFHQAFRAAGSMLNDTRRHCTEQQTLTMKPNVLFNTDPYYACKRWWDMQNYVAPVLEEYSVPFVSYRDLAWPDFTHPPAALPLFWNGLSHPDYKAHALIGKLIAYGFYRLIMDGNKTAGCYNNDINEESYLPKHSNAKERLNKAAIACPNPLLQLEASAEPASENVFLPYIVSQSHWRFYNDSGTKYGWILDATQEQQTTANVSCRRIRRKLSSNRKLCKDFTNTARLSFNMTFGTTPVLRLSYLKSYTENMGAVRVWLDNDRDRFVDLPGKYYDPDWTFSVSHYTTLSAVPLNVSAHALGEWFALPSLTPGLHTVHIGPAPFKGEKFKWKLYSITSC